MVRNPLISDPCEVRSHGAEIRSGIDEGRSFICKSGFFLFEESKVHRVTGTIGIWYTKITCRIMEFGMTGWLRITLL